MSLFECGCRLSVEAAGPATDVAQALVPTGLLFHTSDTRQPLVRRHKHAEEAVPGWGAASLRQQGGGEGVLPAFDPKCFTSQSESRATGALSVRLAGLPHFFFFYFQLVLNMPASGSRDERQEEKAGSGGGGGRQERKKDEIQ